MKVPWLDGPGGHTRKRGSVAESAAVAWLEKRGYRVVARNATNHGGEIDLVALDGDCLCFIEVKARAGRRYGVSLEAVDARKQRRLTRAAALFLAAYEGDPECRFDVLGLDFGGAGWEFTLVRDAFSADY